jgi:hypothetical protein
MVIFELIQPPTEQRFITVALGFPLVLLLIQLTGWLLLVAHLVVVTTEAAVVLVAIEHHTALLVAVGQQRPQSL